MPSFAPMHGSKEARRYGRPNVSDLRSNTWIEVWISNPRISEPCKGRACVSAGLGWCAGSFAGSRTRSLSRGAEAVPDRSGDLGAPRSRRQGCLGCGVASAGKDPRSRCARTRHTRMRCCARRSTATCKLIAQIRATIKQNLARLPAILGLPQPAKSEKDWFALNSSRAQLQLARAPWRGPEDLA